MKPQAWAVATLLCFTAMILGWRGGVDEAPAGAHLEDLPATLEFRKGVDLPLAPGIRDILGKGVFLNRIYRRINKTTDPSASDEVSLFIGYYPSQRAGETMHTPQACLPGAGWSFDQRGTLSFEDRVGSRHRVGEYLISNGQNRQEVLYWYRSDDRTIADDYLAKLSMFFHAIRDRRSDAALIRVMTPVEEHENRQAARDRAVHFAQQLTPMLPAYIPK